MPLFRRFVLCSLFLASLSVSAAPEDGDPSDFPQDEFCPGELADEAFNPFLDPDEDRDPFLDQLYPVKVGLQKVQIAIADWFWGVEGDRAGAKGKYRMLITLRASLRGLEDVDKHLRALRETGERPDALHHLKNFLELALNTLRRQSEIFETDLRLLEFPKDEANSARLAELRQETLRDAAIAQLIPAMRQSLSALNESLVIANRLLEGTEERNNREELQMRALFERIRLVYPLAKVSETVNDTVFVGDEDRVLEVIANLVSNAQQAGNETHDVSIVSEPKQFRDFGEKPVDSAGYRCVSAPTQKAGYYVGVSVSDTAKGMPEAVLRGIFVSGATYSAEKGGTGLGLAYVRKVVLEHGGFIEVKTEMGAGTTFTLWFPAGETVSIQQADTRPEGGYEIIVIDDTRGNLHLSVMFLRSNGFNVQGFATRTLALEYLEQHVDRVRVVLTDKHTGPDISMEGFLAFTQQHPHLFVAVGSGDPEPVSLEPGLSAYYEKPINYPTLLTVFERLVRPEG